MEEVMKTGGHNRASHQHPLSSQIFTKKFRLREDGKTEGNELEAGKLRRNVRKGGRMGRQSNTSMPFLIPSHLKTLWWKKRYKRHK